MDTLRIIIGIILCIPMGSLLLALIINIFIGIFHSDKYCKGINSNHCEQQPAKRNTLYPFFW